MKRKEPSWPYRPSWADRFFAKVDTNPHPTGCHIWMAGKNQQGYGQFHIAGKMYGAHRIGWMLAFGPIPEGWWVLHRCDSPSCVNPDHLFLGTHGINIADKVAKGRWRGGSPPGEKQGNVILTGEQVQEIRAYPRRQVSYKTLAAKYGVSVGTIHSIRIGRSWKHLRHG
jgi:hypothetical protein